MTPVSAAAAIRATRVRTFVRPGDLPGGDVARRQAVSRAVFNGDLVRVRRGLYYRGAETAYGMAAPSPAEVALEALGTRGVGPAGHSAARTWGVTTQVPPTLHLATLKTAEGIPGVKMTQRSNLARTDLNYREIALLELLRDPEVYVEAGWSTFVARVRAARESGEIGEAQLRAAVNGERNVAVRRHFERLASEVFESANSPAPPPARARGHRAAAS